MCLVNSSDVAFSVVAIGKITGGLCCFFESVVMVRCVLRGTHYQMHCCIGYALLYRVVQCL